MRAIGLVFVLCGVGSFTTVAISHGVDRVAAVFMGCVFVGVGFFIATRKQ